MLFFGVFMRETARPVAKSRTNSGKAIKPLDRLTPNLAHMCRFFWEWIYAKSIEPQDTGGNFGGF